MSRRKNGQNRWAENKTGGVQWFYEEDGKPVGFV